MGIYDREYYRREGPSYLDRLIPSGSVCKWLIFVNIGIFVIQLITRSRGDGSGPFTDLFDLQPLSVIDGQVWRLLTYAFLHDPLSLWHILFNMLFLWMFGSEMEGRYGSKEFLAFYLVSAFLGGVTFTALHLFQDPPPSCIGASGAVTAVLVLYAFHFPRQTILVFMILPVPIWAFAVFLVAKDAFQLFGGTQGTIAVSVHLAGAAFAALYYKKQWRLGGSWSNLWSWKARVSAPRLRVYRPESEEAETVSVASLAKSSDLDEHLEAKLDAVLEKVARFGQASLTEGERKILLQASEIYKRKRS